MIGGNEAFLTDGFLLQQIMSYSLCSILSFLSLLPQFSFWLNDTNAQELLYNIY